MSVRILCITLLLFSMCLWAQARWPPGIVPLCCTKVSSTQVSFDVTEKPYMQKARGRCVDAIIFTTEKGKLCVSPDVEWAKKLFDEMTKQ
ncbi:uncharacterized protein LOC113164481 [Lates japonicus]|uniref:Chemokine interleukin-8-like domain-containing protein n=1 Tax=Lates japonicus TaxID=270547 RepID=A0AAD3R4B0_LATJO|nr:uncharacterized protein AKAME5_000710000 [Lates japonicus]